MLGGLGAGGNPSIEKFIFRSLWIPPDKTGSLEVPPPNPENILGWQSMGEDSARAHLQSSEEATNVWIVFTNNTQLHAIFPTESGIAQFTIRLLHALIKSSRTINRIWKLKVLINPHSSFSI